MCMKFIGKVTKFKGVMSRKRTHIYVWAFLQVSSLVLWFRSTLPLIIKIIKDKNKTGAHEIEKPIIDSTLDFTKDLICSL